MCKLNIFGENSCELELQRYRTEYQEYYFDHAPFNRQILERDRYLVVGRRGAGKSSLIQYLHFQNELPGADVITVGGAPLEALYNSFFEAFKGDESPLTLAIPKFRDHWTSIIWASLFEYFRADDEVIASAYALTTKKKGILGVIGATAKGIFRDRVTKETEIFDRTREFLENKATKLAQAAIMKRLAAVPVIVAFDSLEHYKLNDDKMMGILAGLIECASNFNIKYSGEGLHIKVFMTDEIYPHLSESKIQNMSKHLRRPVFLHWRPKDLIRLICWRYNRYLESIESKESRDDVDWDSFSEVTEKIWNPSFGKKLVNGRGKSEATFPYFLRHTQMKPREMIIHCNEMARDSRVFEAPSSFDAGGYPGALSRSTHEIAGQVLNSYSNIYPHLPDIVDSLVNEPMLFSASALDAMAHRTGSAWRDSGYKYSPLMFRKILCEAGIIGRVRSSDDRVLIAEGDYEYSMPDRLAINEHSLVAIHPMFYEKLKIDTSAGWRVFPFPDHPDFEELKMMYNKG